MIKCNRLLSAIALALLLSVISFGCSGGGGAAPPSPSPSIQTTPSNYSFGTVTPGNSPAPLDLEIRNVGTANLNVSGISLLDTNNYQLSLGGGSNPCGTLPRTIAPGGNCTVGIQFAPIPGLPSYDTYLTIISDDPDNTTLNVLLSGLREAITTLNLRINQLGVNCDNGDVTAYVSVTDQGGYPVTALTTNHFTVTGPAGYGGHPTAASYAGDVATLSVALVMDFSTSVANVESKLLDMKAAATGFVNQLGAGDEAAIIKFGGTGPQAIQLVAPFTDNTEELVTKINAYWFNGAGTLLYDAVKAAIDNTAPRQKDRKAVIVISDGLSHDTLISLGDLVDYALSKNVPIFSVGLGDNVNVNYQGLTTMADNTGGLYYGAITSDNLQTVYEQLADLLFRHQYILSYSPGSIPGVTDNTTIRATLPGSLPEIYGEDMRDIDFTLICP